MTTKAAIISSLLINKKSIAQTVSFSCVRRRSMKLEFVPTFAIAQTKVDE